MRSAGIIFTNIYRSDWNMQRPACIILFIISCLFIFCQCGKTDNDNQDNTRLNQEFSSSPNDRVVSRISGVAPLSVHFFSDFVDSVSGEDRIDRFHHYDYTWNFGDTGSGNWGTSGKSRNMAKGAVAVHVFENTGDYHVTLTIRDHSGIAGTENYTVSDPDSL